VTSVSGFFSLPALLWRSAQAAVLLSLLASGAMLYVSSWNYPGGAVLEQFHRLIVQQQQQQQR
jgi:hypothetical protein